MPKDIAKRKTFVNPRTLCCLRLLLYTGARLSEIATLKWEHIDFELATFALPSRKGDERKPHPVSISAVEILSEIQRVHGSPYVLPGCKEPTQRDHHQSLCEP
ncbi:tyrosine-type recombinase/integrase [Pseudovibrio sp. FO-BEG1]|uniref:tyrosine-type recombinase/integrase n=1 Tax=Pseudovibrio sp. (strain FO-BEG1) TaxID=911045 RepID=UPI001AD8D578